MKKIIVGIGFFAGVSPFGTALAEPEFPTKPITLLVGFAAGGGTDVVARKVAEQMEKELGVPVVVINKPGGGSVVAWKELVASKPDGYTISMFLPLNAFIQKHLASSKSWIDPLSEIRMLGIVNEDPWGIATKADAPYENGKEFSDWTKSNPGAVVGDGGEATAYHWGWEAFANASGADIRSITYRGATADGLKSAANGEVSATAAGAPEAQSMMSSGHIKMLGVAAMERLPAYPDIPTFKEQGIDLIFGITRGFAVPRDTPDAVVEKLAKSIKAASDSKSFQDFLTTSGFGGRYLSPADSDTYLAQQDELFKGLMQRAGVLRPEQ